MPLPSKDTKAYVCNPKIQLKKLSAFLEEAGAVIAKAKIQIMYARISPLSLAHNEFKPKMNDSYTFVNLNKEFGARYEYLIGLVYVPKGTKNNIYNDDTNDWIFFNEYIPFAADLIRKMQIPAPYDVLKQTGISEDNLEQYRLASILFPVKGLGKP